MSFFREHIVKPLTRSSRWRKVRKEFVDTYDVCWVCDSKRGLEVHHIRDFSTDPQLELEWDNLITLCRKHHLLFGHLNYWKSINPQVVIDTKIWRWKIRGRR